MAALAQEPMVEDQETAAIKTKRPEADAGAAAADGADGPEEEAPATKRQKTVDTSRFLRAQKRVFSGLTAADEGTWQGDFRFVLLADPQLGMLRQDKSWQEEAAMLDLAVRHVNRLKPRFVVVCGDLINAWPDSGAKVVDAQNEDFQKGMAKVDESIPLVCLCGNHDVGNSPTRQTIASYAKRYGDDYFVFWVGGVKFIVLNTQLYSDPSSAPDLAEQQDAWLTAMLEGPATPPAAPTAVPDATASSSSSSSAAAAAAEPEPAPAETTTTTSAGSKAAPPPPAPMPTHTVAFSHIPPFIEKPDEPLGYFNLCPATRGPLLRKMKRGGVCKWFCGHYHRNAGGWDEGLEVVTSSATGAILRPSGKDPLGIGGFLLPPEVGADKSGLRVVNVTQEQINHEWMTLDSVPQSLDGP